LRQILSYAFRDFVTLIGGHCGSEAMDFSNKPVWVILGVPLLAVAAYNLGVLGESDRQKFDRLQIGMSAVEVQDIVFPRPSGKYAHYMQRMPIGPNDNIHFNECFVLTMRDGVLVDKQWTGKEERARFAPPR
jgi:hypothetical protein